MKETIKDQASLNLHYDEAIRWRRILILLIILTVLVTMGFSVGNMMLWTVIAFMLGAAAIVACSVKLNAYYDAIDKWCESVSGGTGYRQIKVIVTDLSDGSIPKVGFYISSSRYVSYFSASRDAGNQERCGMGCSVAGSSTRTSTLSRRPDYRGYTCH